MSRRFWLVALAAVVLAGLALAAGCAEKSPSEASPDGRVAIAVTDGGFLPAIVTVPQGRAVTLVVTRKTDHTCATEIVFGDEGIHRELPLNQSVEITLAPHEPGQVHYTCGMNMMSGTVLIR